MSKAVFLYESNENFTQLQEQFFIWLSFRKTLILTLPVRCSSRISILLNQVEESIHFKNRFFD